MKTQETQNHQYIAAKIRVDKLKKFYKQLAVYVIVNIFLTAIFIIGDMNDGDTFEEAFLNTSNYKVWFYWGIAIAISAIGVFGFPALFSKDWEERKIIEYLNDKKK